MCWLCSDSLVCGAVPYTRLNVRAVASAWKPVSASAEYVAYMRSLWVASMAATSGVPASRIPELHSLHTTSVKVTTGLGLPLCRGFAHSSGGWVALEEGETDGMTHLWAVLAADGPRGTPPRHARILEEKSVVTEGKQGDCNAPSASRSPQVPGPPTVTGHSSGYDKTVAG